VADFNFLLSTLGLTNGNLASHMARLEREGYVAVNKSFNGRIPHTDYRLTPAGRKALAEYWASLDEIRASGRKARRLGSREGACATESSATLLG